MVVAEAWGALEHSELQTLVLQQLLMVTFQAPCSFVLQAVMCSSPQPERWDQVMLDGFVVAHSINASF